MRNLGTELSLVATADGIQKNVFGARCSQH
jgi:hypothetical protein